MICASRVVPSVAVTSAWVSPRVNSAEPWVRGNVPTFTVIGRTVLWSRPSMRGLPLRMFSRTMRLSSLKNSSPTCSLLKARPLSSAVSAATVAALISPMRV